MHRALDLRAGESADGAALVLGERRFLARFTLRGHVDADAVRRATGVPLPAQANTVASGNNLAAMWLGPDEWLIVGPPNSQGAVGACLAEALAGARCAIVDVTDGFTALRIGGPMAPDLLAMGCPLDLHPRVFGPNRCARSHLARTQVIVHRIEEPAGFDVHVERSQADYLWTWLGTAGAPYGVAVAPQDPAPSWRRPARRQGARA